MTIKPGFVDTPMTAHLKKGLLFAAPAEVARDIHKALLSKRDILYTPGYWRWIMFTVCAIPEVFFKKLGFQFVRKG